MTPTHTDPLPWPHDGLTDVSYGVYIDPAQYAPKNERLFKGHSWNCLCLSSEVQETGDFVVTGIAGMTIIVVRVLGRSEVIEDGDAVTKPSRTALAK